MQGHMDRQTKNITKADGALEAIEKDIERQQAELQNPSKKKFRSQLQKCVDANLKKKKSILHNKKEWQGKINDVQKKIDN